MNTKLLKQKILDLAIRGKLTQQLKSDGNTADLLKKICDRTQEKTSLRAKRGNPSPQTIIPLDKSEVPFEVPANWEWVRLGDLSESIQYGYNAPAKDNGRIKMVRISDIHENEVEWETVPFCDIDEADIKIYSLKKNDILFARTGGTVGKSYIVNDLPEEAVYAGYLIRTRYSENISAQYMKFFMESALYWDQLKDGCIATAQPNCNGKTLGKMQIPLPPFAEQQRIVEKIQEAFAEIDSIENNKELLKTHIKQARQKILDLAIHGKLVPQNKSDEPASVLLERITRDNPHYEKIEDEPFEIPENWAWCKLGDVLNIARGGSPRPIQDYLTDDENGLNWIKIGDAEKGGKYIETVKEKIKPSGLSHTRAVKAGDFLLTNSMSFGRPYILKVDGCIHDGWLVLGNVKKSMIPDFLYFMLSSDFIYQSFAFAAAGSTVKNLKSETVQRTLFPLPPLTEQSRIVTKIEELFSALDQMERNLV